MILGFNADEVFRIAIEIEKNGMAFYKKARAVQIHDRLRQIFDNLVKEEEKHLEIFEEMRAELPEEAKRKTDYDPSNDFQRDAESEIDQYIRDAADMNVFRKPENVEKYIGNIKSAEDALRLAIQFEKDSITFYLILRDLTEEDKGKKSVDKILAQEKEHLKTLSRELRNEVGCKNLSVYQMPVCAGQTAMDAEQARSVNPDEPCDDARSGP